MKYFALIFSLLLAGGANAAEARSFATNAEILELKQDGGFPVAKAEAKYQPECGDEFLRVEQKPAEYDSAGDRIVEVAVVVQRNPSIYCVMRPLPETVSFEVSTEAGPVKLVESGEARAAAPLAVYHKFPGFEPRPQHVYVVVDADGAVTAKVTGYYSEEPVTERSLGRLAPEELADLKAKVNAITDEELVDRDAGEPRCTDAPSYRWTIHREASPAPMTIAMRSGCHDFHLQSWTNGPLADNVKALLDRYVELFYNRE